MKYVKISDDVHERLQKLAEKLGLSMNQTIEVLLEHYMGGISVDKPIRSKVDLMIFAKYKSKCSKCSREINPGEQIRYVKLEYEDGSKDVYVICPECLVDSTLLAKTYKRKRELEVIVRELRKEADSLVERIKELEREANMLTLLKKISDTISDVKFLLRDYRGNETLVQILERLDNLKEIVKEIEALRETGIQVSTPRLRLQKPAKTP